MIEYDSAMKFLYKYMKTFDFLYRKIKTEIKRFFRINRTSINKKITCDLLVLIYH